MGEITPEQMLAESNLIIDRVKTRSVVSPATQFLYMARNKLDKMTPKHYEKLKASIEQTTTKESLSQQREKGKE